MMDTEQLYLIQARADAATPARWHIIYRGYDTMGWDIDGPEPGSRGAFSKRADAEFVAHAREDIPALLAALHKQRAITITQLQEFGTAHDKAHIKVLQDKVDALRAENDRLTRAWAEAKESVNEASSSGYSAGRVEIERLQAELSKRENHDLVAFVAGAQWWEYHETGATMWNSDIRLAEEEAEKRGYPYTTTYQRYMEGEIERLREELDHEHNVVAAEIARLTAKLRQWGIPVWCECDPNKRDGDISMDVCDAYLSGQNGWCKLCGHDRACHKESKSHDKTSIQDHTRRNG